MKSLNKIFLLTGLLSLLFAACKNDPELTQLQPVSFASGITASVSAVVITAESESSTLITFNWAEVKYPVDAPVTYSLQVDVPADTIGATPWSNAKEILAGENIFTRAVMGSDLNTIAKDLGLEPGVPGILVIRTKSYLDREAYSSPVSITVTPYQAAASYPSLYVPGDYQGWNPANAPSIVSVKSNNVYEGYIYIPAGGTMQFKLTAQPDWTPMAYGDGGNGVLIEANYSGGNFNAPSEGYYELTADLNTMTYTVTKTTWSILGDATPGGWDTDTELSYDPAKNVWEVKADLKPGSFKFRANKAWVIDFGLDSEGKLAYSDHPVFGYDSSIVNIGVSTSGNYTITLDLHNPGNYTYKLKKN